MRKSKTTRSNPLKVSVHLELDDDCEHYMCYAIIDYDGRLYQTSNILAITRTEAVRRFLDDRLQRQIFNGLKKKLHELDLD